MTCARLTRTFALSVLVAGMGLVSWAQDKPATSENSAYKDRVIEGLTSLATDEINSEQTLYDPEGWARYLKFETRLGTDTFNQSKTSVGVSIYGLVETPNYGVLSVDLNTAPNGRNALTLRQRGMPLEGGWRINNEAGVIGTSAPALTRLPSRVYVPSTLIEGLNTDWSNRGSGLHLQASAGQPGRMEGYPTSGFKALSGHTASVGAQFDAEPWQIAARLANANGITLLDAPTQPGDYIDAHSAQVSARRAEGPLSVQANLVSTNASNVSGARKGFWLDAEWKREAQNNTTWGLYWLDKDLSWAGQPMVNDTSGAYVRSTWYTRQWSAEGGLDWLRSVSNPDQTGIFATGNVRRRYSRDLTLGAGASVRHFNGDAWTTYAEARMQNNWGSTSARFTLANELDQTRSNMLSLDHDWILPTGWSLTTSLGVGHETSTAQSKNRWNAAVSLGAPVSANTMANAHLSTDRTDSGDAQTSASLNLNWRINSYWSLDSSYNYARGQGRAIVLIDPLAAPTILPSATNSSQTVLFVLRYEDRAGSRSAPLGGRPLDGGGRIEGIVFLDANRNGRQEASETGVSGVTVYLDNLYAVRTDAQGRFEFPFVAAGAHVVTVLNETLPLPWMAAGDGRNPVDVRVRDSTQVRIGAVRQGSE